MAKSNQTRHRYGQDGVTMKLNYGSPISTTTQLSLTKKAQRHIWRTNLHVSIFSSKVEPIKYLHAALSFQIREKNLAGTQT